MLDEKVAIVYGAGAIGSTVAKAPPRRGPMCKGKQVGRPA